MRITNNRKFTKSFVKPIPDTTSKHEVKFKELKSEQTSSSMNKMQH